MSSAQHALDYEYHRVNIIIAGLVYPLTTKTLITQLGFNHAVQSVAGITSATALLSFFLAVPNPNQPLTKPDNGWRSLDAWVDKHAFRRRSYLFFVIAISLTFFGFYAIFFNLEEVRTFMIWTVYVSGMLKTSCSGLRSVVSAKETNLRPT